MVGRRDSEEFARLQAFSDLKAKEAKQSAQLPALREEVAELRAMLLAAGRSGSTADPSAVPVAVSSASGSRVNLAPKRRAREEFPALPQPRQTRLQSSGTAVVTKADLEAFYRRRR